MNTKKITYSSVLIAFGIALPFIFHFAFLTPEPAFYFDPLHYSAMFAGGFFGPLIGGIVGLLTVGLSSILTGMPPMPQQVQMLFEVPIYGIVFGLLYYKFRYNIYISLVIAMIIGRIVSILAALLVGHYIFNNAFAIANILTDLTKGLVGCVLQLLIVPIVVIRINNVFGFRKDKIFEFKN